MNTFEGVFLSSIIVFKNSERLTIANGGILVDLKTGKITLSVAPQKGDVISCEYPYCATKLIKIERVHQKKQVIKRPYYNKNRW